MFTLYCAQCIYTLSLEETMDIILRNETDDPIYKQIIDQVKAQIIAGKLTAGDTLPSMRALATQLRISVITTKRAYEELEREGYIENFLGKGCFVKSQNTDFLREETVRQTEEMVAQIFQKARLCGLKADDLKEMIDLMYLEENKND